MRSLRTILNEGNPNKLADANQQLQMGEAMALVPRTFRGAVPASDILVLPEAAKCAAVLSAFGQGTVPGYKTGLASGLAPATLQCAPNAAGDILFNAVTDEITFAEVSYLAYEGPIVEDLVVVSTVDDIGLLLGGRAAAVLIEVEALVGTVTGLKVPANRAGAAATTRCAITELGTGVLFNAATDEVTSARIRYIAQPGVGDGSRVSVSANLDVEDKEY